MDRLQWLRQNLPVDRPGIEIGPLDRPVLLRPDYKVLYADHLDRDHLCAKYASHPTVDSKKIPEIDFIIGDEGLKSSLSHHPEGIHYLIASHVIEHLPDPIRWFSDAYDLLEDEGSIVLAIPDHRQCFDTLRRPTTPGEWIDAALLGHTRPSPGKIFDALYQEVTLGAAIVWNGYPNLAGLKRSRTAQHALAIARQALVSKEYVDVHCWVFTPKSFCNLMRDLVLAGAIKFILDEVTSTFGCEFFARLTKRSSLHQTRVAATYPASGERYNELPPDFDALGYCNFNPDVVEALVDPNDHYIEYGRHEGRRWR